MIPAHGGASRRRSRTFAALLGGLVFALLTLLTTSASASYHLASISEVHADGDGLGPDHDFVELQFYADGQNLVGGHWVATYDNSGAILNSYMIPTNVTFGESQRTVLIVENGSDSGSDFQPANLQVPTGAGGGGVCYTDNNPTTPPVVGIDCVAFGTVTSLSASSSPIGTPALASAGLAPGQSLHRTIARGCPTLLEAVDDTNDSAADFALGPPSPRVNPVAPTERPCATAAAPSATKKCRKGFKLKKIKKKGKETRKKCVRVKKKRKR